MKKQILLFVLFATTALFAQRISKEKASYKFIQLPKSPLSSEITGYNTEVKLAYLESLAERKQRYDEAYRLNEENYQNEVNRAHESYDAEMKAYNDQSAGKQILKSLLTKEGNKKPVLKLPQKTEIDKPYFEKEFNTEMLKGKYGKLEGYNVGGANPVDIVISVHRFEHLDPVLKTSSKKVKQSDGTYISVNEYYYTVQYKNDVSFSIGNGGSIINDVTPEQCTQYKSASTQKFSSQSKLENWWKTGKESFLRRFNEKAVSDNLNTLSMVINDMYGFPQIKRVSEIAVPKHKKQDYSDYVKAYALAKPGYNALMQDVKRAEAKEKLVQAIEIWEKALEEAKPEETSAKKARITRDVTTATYRMIIDAATLCHDYEKVDEYMIKFLSMDTKRSDEKKVEVLKNFVNTQKERYDAYVELNGEI